MKERLAVRSAATQVLGIGLWLSVLCAVFGNAVELLVNRSIKTVSFLHRDSSCVVSAVFLKSGNTNV